MDNKKTGELIRKLRLENSMTQLQLAEKLHISDKAVSKWERGVGSPDVSLLMELARIFKVDVKILLSGEMDRNRVFGGDVKKLKYYVCPDCGNLVTSMIGTRISCCGRILQEQIPEKAKPEEMLCVENVEQDYYITSNHEMSKSHYIAFLAFITTDTYILKKLYPQWDMQVRLPVFAHGRLLWYCTKHGLFYQEI